jgi:hypothetical protein
MKQVCLDFGCHSFKMYLYLNQFKNSRLSEWSLKNSILCETEKNHQKPQDGGVLAGIRRCNILNTDQKCYRLNQHAR